MKKRLTIDFVQWTIDIESQSFLDAGSSARACTKDDFASNKGLTEEIIQIGGLAICPQNEQLVL